MASSQESQYWEGWSGRGEAEPGSERQANQGWTDQYAESQKANGWSVEMLARRKGQSIRGVAGSWKANSQSVGKQVRVVWLVHVATGSQWLMPAQRKVGWEGSVSTQGGRRPEGQQPACRKVTWVSLVSTQGDWELGDRQPAWRKAGLELISQYTVAGHRKADGCPPGRLAKADLISMWVQKGVWCLFFI
ncbi:hypothetical protein chiPu_0015177 [Chiloscyllium punctatum]|uniref:Uncharacterized protein n=1 Tax=Chiloscyllium punctatum TaxID=137246 RepID=A0A401T220_CHIPU|nr:hypothetical protein [Chiloscyllium punctatum]